jgi:hypothetical protein
MKRTLVLWLASLGALTAATLTTAGAASAAAPYTCSGSLDNPGVLSGTYSTNVFVSGACVTGAPTTVTGNVFLQPGSVLIADDFMANGNVQVGSGATLVGGPTEEGGDESGPPAPQSFHVGGNLIATQPLGVVLHGSDIVGNVVETGGGGGFNCDPSGVFTLFDSPVFSVIGEGSHVGGNVTITGLTSCWLGLTHSQFDGNVHVLNNQLADPDAIEILDNDIAGNIVCEQNSMMWDSADITEALYPRMWEPNRVSGIRVGQCVVAPPPLTPDGTSPGAF